MSTQLEQICQRLPREPINPAVLDKLRDLIHSADNNARMVPIDVGGDDDVVRRQLAAPLRDLLEHLDSLRELGCGAAEFEVVDLVVHTHCLFANLLGGKEQAWRAKFGALPRLHVLLVWAVVELDAVVVHQKEAVDAIAELWWQFHERVAGR